MIWDEAFMPPVVAAIKPPRKSNGNVAMVGEDGKVVDDNKDDGLSGSAKKEMSLSLDPFSLKTRELVLESAPPMPSQVPPEPPIHPRKPPWDNLIMAQESLLTKEEKIKKKNKKKARKNLSPDPEPKSNVISRVMTLRFKDPLVKNSEWNAPRDAGNSKEE